MEQRGVKDDFQVFSLITWKVRVAIKSKPGKSEERKDLGQHIRSLVLYGIHLRHMLDIQAKMSSRQLDI